MIKQGQIITWNKRKAIVKAVGRGPGPRNTLLQFLDNGEQVVYTWPVQKYGKLVK